METLNRTFNNATTALWNEFQPGEQQQLQPHGDEPLSGIQGKGTATDPYDGGNRDDQPGAPRTNANTAVIPEPLVSVTGTSAHDHAKNPKSPSNADVALKSVIVDEPLLQQQQPPKKMETPDPLTAAAPTAAAEAAGAPSSGSHGAKQLAASGVGVGLPAGKTQMSSTGGVSEQRGSLPATSKGQVPSYVGVSGSGSGSGSGAAAAAAAGAGETLAIREKEKEKEKDEILHENRGLPAPEGMGPEQKSSSTAAGTTPITAGGSTGTGALQTRDTPATIPDSSISADDKAYTSSKAKPSTSATTTTSQPQQQQQQQLKPTTTSTATQPTSAAGAADAAASDTESVGPTNETKEARDSTISPTAQKHHETETATATATDTLPRGNTKVSEEALKGPQTPAPREPFEFEKRLGSKGGPAKSDAGGGAGGGTGAADEAEKHGKGHGQGKMAHLKEKVGKVLHHGK
ncbi:uncharacterized protein BO95DRAFT_463146 [Aspergillus brunneoviolaceus CBS 621.78]|uniref:Uncharacterized protein n=1 Tax=Aspergillus brunneoviolaceus CBS 621.78 TaxID=1450534 RepID=A0ACD1GAR2_9EURO|nr:hypothetical protein BO95DRAFT_463146 [Aspergillus brunneoviolaceus CBS 621.78]RAH46379.1 hypothetical protein BO95DRAFT_463146 [Aspergillus brunneoviolaceus CBS 621.78]